MLRGKVMSKEIVRRIVREIISITIDSSVENFDMRVIETEVDRIVRIEKGVSMRKELVTRLRLEKERKAVKVKRENAIVLRDVRKVVRNYIEIAMY